MAQVTVRDFLAGVEDDCPGTVVVADMEAGLEHLSRAGGTLRHVDLLLVVVDATHKVLLTAARTTALARQLGIAEIAYVANRARPGDAERVRSFTAEHGGELVAELPVDEAVPDADRLGVSVLDHAPHSPSVRGIEELAETLARRLAPAGPRRAAFRKEMASSKSWPVTSAAAAPVGRPTIEPS